MNYPSLAASLLLLGAFTLPPCAIARDDNGSDTDTRPDGRGNLVRGQTRAGIGAAVVQGNGINYHNGPVMQGTTNVYYIWYGDWTQAPRANNVLTNLASHIGGSPYFNINTTYGDTTGNVANSVSYAGSTTDSGSLGTSLSDNSIWTIVTNSITPHGPFPVDANGVYFVLTAPGVKETSGFLTQYCGWHSYGTIGSTNIKFAFVGDAQGPSLGACAAQSVSPNNDAGADGMASVIAHELEESVSDPLLNAWYDSAGNENADKCAWTFGATYNANGAAANMALGGLNYLIQQNWLNAGGGKCALSYSSAADFSVSVSPSSQTVLQGATSGNYTLAATPSGNFTGTVAWKVTPPSGINASAVSTSGTFTLTAANAAPGSYTIPITGTSGSLTHSTTATLVVTSNSTFTMTISPSSRTVTRPSSGSVSTTYAVTVTPSGSFTSDVSLTVSGGRTGISPLLSPTLIKGGSGGSTLTVAVTSSSRRTTRTLTVTGTDTVSGLTKTVTATIVIQ